MSPAQPATSHDSRSGRELRPAEVANHLRTGGPLTPLVPPGTGGHNPVAAACNRRTNSLPTQPPLRQWRKRFRKSNATPQPYEYLPTLFGFIFLRDTGIRCAHLRSFSELGSDGRANLFLARYNIGCKHFQKTSDGLQSTLWGANRLDDREISVDINPRGLPTLKAVSHFSAVGKNSTCP